MSNCDRCSAVRPHMACARGRSFIRYLAVCHRIRVPRSHAAPPDRPSDRWARRSCNSSDAILHASETLPRRTTSSASAPACPACVTVLYRLAPSAEVAEGMPGRDRPIAQARSRNGRGDVRSCHHPRAVESSSMGALSMCRRSLSQLRDGLTCTGRTRPIRTSERSL